MSKKKIIIIAVAVLLIVGLVFSKKKTNTDPQQTDTSKNQYKDGYTQKPSTGTGQNSNVTQKDQSEVTMTSAALDHVVDVMKQVFTQGVYYWEGQELINVCEDYIFTRADIMKIKERYKDFDLHMAKMMNNHYMEGKSKQVVAAMNEALKKNGVDYQFK